MSDMQQSDLPMQVVESLKTAYAQETEERKRLRAQNAEQIIVALAGGPDPFGKPARKNR